MKKDRHFPYFLLMLLMMLCQARSTAQQTGFRERFTFDLQFGSRSFQRESLPEGRDLDFLNFLETGTGWDASQYLDLGFSLKTTEQWTFSTDLKLMSDFRPGHLGISAQYKHRKTPGRFMVGVRADFNVCKLTINQFNQYHVRNDSGFYADLNTNYRQVNLTDMSLGISPFIEMNPRRFRLKFTSGTGVNLFMPFSENIVQKKTGSNLKREIRYNTHAGPALFVAADLMVRFDLVRSENLSLGLMLQAAQLFSRRALPYTRITDSWTYENTVDENITPEKTWFSRRDLSLGVYLGL